MDIRSKFPLLAESGIVYLDSASTTQKPKAVIEGVAEYLSSSYANIHRGSYALSEQSEILYKKSKKAVATLIDAESSNEIIFTSNATGAFNLLAQSLNISGLLKK